MSRWELVELPANVVRAEIVEHPTPGWAHVVYHYAGGAVGQSPTMELDPCEGFGREKPVTAGFLRSAALSFDPQDIGPLIPIRWKVTSQ